MDVERGEEIRETEIHHDLHRDEQRQPQQSFQMARPEHGEHAEQDDEAEQEVHERRQHARSRQELQRQTDLLHDRRIRDDRRGTGLERIREERPGQQTNEEEHRVGLLPRLGAWPRSEQHAEQDPEHDELQQRDEKVPSEPEDRSLVARAELAPREVTEKLAPFDKRTEVSDHGGSMLRDP
jgi:hypothetical protein